MTVKANAVITLIRVNDGANGKDGTSVKITGKSVTYQASTSGTTTPTGTWVASPPTVAKGRYLWTKTVVTYSDGNSTTAYSVAYQGTNGTNGQNGTNGIGVKSTEVTYQIWTDGITTPTGSWSTNVPKTTADAPYLWTRTIITYTDNTTSTSYSVGSTPEGISIGGRNLLRNTSFKNYTASDEIKIDNTYTKFSNNTLKLVCDNTNGTTSTKYVVVSNLKSTWSLADVLGQDITISMWIYIETAGQVDGYEFRIVFTHEGNMQWNNPNRNYPVVIPSPSELKAGWNYIYATYRIAEDSTKANFNFTCNSRPGKTSTCWISSPKAEFGNKPTAWTPAPEDVDADISNAQTSADKAQTNASTAQQTANDAQSTANDALNKANSAQESANSAIKSYQDAINKAKDAQISADRATELANGAQQGVSNIEQVVKIDTQGVRIYEKENSKNYVHQKSDGSHFYTNNAENGVLGPDSRMNNLAVNDYFMSASHRMEYGNVLNQDASVFYHIGKLKKVVQ